MNTAEWDYEIIFSFKQQLRGCVHWHAFTWITAFTCEANDLRDNDDLHDN